MGEIADGTLRRRRWAVKEVEEEVERIERRGTAVAVAVHRRLEVSLSPTVLQKRRLGLSPSLPTSTSARGRDADTVLLTPALLPPSSRLELLSTLPSLPLLPISLPFHFIRYNLVRFKTGRIDCYDFSDSSSTTINTLHLSLALLSFITSAKQVRADFSSTTERIAAGGPPADAVLAQPYWNGHFEAT